MTSLLSLWRINREKLKIIKQFVICISLILCSLYLSGCSKEKGKSRAADEIKQISQHASYPYVVKEDSVYYLLKQAPPPNTITLQALMNPDSLGMATPVVVWDGNLHEMNNIWSPEMVKIKDKWYIYFEADNGYTDNHQLYVIENKNPDPLQGEWKLHGPIITDSEWNFGIHPSSIVVNGIQYLLWSGWEHCRAETETQCIFIARMENPWTLGSERVLISRPEYEWERQWINPDGSRSAYPIFVNENPEAFLSPDGKKVIVAYSASGIWTPYSTIGLLYTDTASDLLSAMSWTKLDEPQSAINPVSSEMIGISNISVVPCSSPEKSLLFFQARNIVEGESIANIYLKKIEWDENSLPLFRLK